MWWCVILCPCPPDTSLLPSCTATAYNHSQSSGHTKQYPNRDTSADLWDDSAVSRLTGDPWVAGRSRAMSRWEGGTRLHAADVVCWDDCAALGAVGTLAPHIPTEWVLVRAVQHGGVVGGDTTGGEGGGGVVEVVLEGEGGGAAFRGVTHEGQPLLPIAVSRTGATEVANHRNTWAKGRRRGGEGRGGEGRGGEGHRVRM